MKKIDLVLSNRLLKLAKRIAKQDEFTCSERNDEPKFKCCQKQDLTAIRQAYEIINNWRDIAKSIIAKVEKE